MAQRSPQRFSLAHTDETQLFGSSCGGNGYFAIWLKSEGYSVVDRNILPTGTSLISAACVVLWGFLSDYTGSRFLWLLIPMVSSCLMPEAHGMEVWSAARLTMRQVLGLIPNGILAVWPASIALKKSAFLTVNIHLVTAVL